MWCKNGSGDPGSLSKREGVMEKQSCNAKRTIDQEIEQKTFAVLDHRRGDDSVTQQLGGDSDCLVSPGAIPPPGVEDSEARETINHFAPIGNSHSRTPTKGSLSPSSSSTKRASRTPLEKQAVQR